MVRIRKIVGALALCVPILSLSAGPGLAESHLLQPEFTFKRIGVPQPGSVPRITVQVAPSGPSTPSSPAAAGSGNGTNTGASSSSAPRRTATYAWYWDIVSPDIGDSGPGRLDEGVRALRSGPGGASVTSPRLDTLRTIAAGHGTDILVATIGTEVSPALVVAVIAVESAGRADAVSGAGAQGLMQLIPATAERFGVADSLDPSENIKGGTAYLDWLMEEFDSDPILALAAYNAGEGAVRSNSGVPDYAETRDYVPKVLAAWAVARGLCQTPPVLISDGCVFAVDASNG